MIASFLRVSVALVYVGGGALHLALVVGGRLDLYHLFGDFALVPFYGAVWDAVVVPSRPWIVLPVVVFEWVVGVMMLAAGRTARLGQGAGAAWNLLLAPFGPWGWTNLLLAALHAWLAGTHFERPVWSAIVRRGANPRRLAARGSAAQGPTPPRPPPTFAAEGARIHE